VAIIDVGAVPAPLFNCRVAVLVAVGAPTVTNVRAVLFEDPETVAVPYVEAVTPRRIVVVAGKDVPALTMVTVGVVVTVAVPDTMEADRVIHPCQIRLIGIVRIVAAFAVAEPASIFAVFGRAKAVVKVPVPALAVTVPLTGCVAWKNVPETGCVTADPSTLTAPAALTLATFAPPVSTILVFWVPPVRVASRARAEVLRLVPAFAVTVPEIG